MNSCHENRNENEWTYPSITSMPVTDNYFGKDIVDDYRNIENLDSADVKKWFKAETEFARGVIGSISGRDSLKNEIESFEFSSNIRATIPRAGANGIFFTRRNVKDNSVALFHKDEKDDATVQLFTTSSLKNAKTKTYSVDYYEPSFDGKFVAMGVSMNGAEMSTLYILDVSKRAILSDSISRAMYGLPGWHPDGSGFFYNQLREVDEKDTDKMYENSCVRFHKIGTDPESDQEVFSKKLNKELNLSSIDFPYIFTFPSSNKVMAVIYHGSIDYCITYYADLKDVLEKPLKTAWVNVSKVEDKVTRHELFENKLFLLNFKNSSNGEFVKIDLDNPKKNEIIIKGEDYVLQTVIQNKNALYVKYLKNGIHGLIELDPTTLKQRDLTLPLQGSITLSSDGRNYLHSNLLYLGMDSWSKEYGIYKFDNGKFSLTDIRPQGEFGQTSYLVSKEVLVASHDGMLVPLSIIYHKDAKLDSKNPTILTAYGSFGISLNPEYSYSRLAWLKKGGVYAVAHVRGGGEKGDQWYRDGSKDRKYNSWKDFIACAAYLIENKYTSSDKLAAIGESAGAIVIGRAITEKPNLFKAAVINVGVLNTIRFENSKNSLATSEFGTVKDSADFENLYEMDVYHHIARDLQYPSILFTAGMNDARVVPWQPAKAVAKFQSSTKSDNIILFKVTDQGHFSDTEVAAESETYSFLLWQLGHPEFKYIKK